eukprot:CAMPEP_0198321526 /NCGR_PEP_ID=MMETSP1450-20131203/10229_1 /TAXON_ID=753684 ORGANISM="Madagascaria erythrocladiodes, Strain CCMP3234" /NCGR_SAMPLE_ID=MMETSP1450 /ASSEMBLY_ACC=CAM_ASM_001115 /LENGTH=67 /DNA_ID=CAMNT_0044025095 /DNA_START=107 /DNA_END=310 /DNA_ORIENTATION=+
MRRAPSDMCRANSGASLASSAPYIVLYAYTTLALASSSAATAGSAASASTACMRCLAAVRMGSLAHK